MPLGLMRSSTRMISIISLLEVTTFCQEYFSVSRRRRSTLARTSRPRCASTASTASELASAVTSSSSVWSKLRLPAPDRRSK